ncbi:MAG: hypothetical protein KF712_03220 [Akkermansiaceae bacterium]|nr:hypothetical protein [Akkermansiaceae bacterium]
MQHLFRRTKLKEAELAIHLAGSLARRCAHLTLPILQEHDPQGLGPLTSSRLHLINSVDNLTANLRTGVILNLPSGQAILPLLEHTFPEEATPISRNSRSHRLAVWDLESAPVDPNAVVTFMAAARGEASPYLAILIGVAEEVTTSPVLDLLHEHFGNRVPLFELYGDSVILHLSERHRLPLSRHSVAAVLAILACFPAFQDLVSAVKPVEPDEADILIEIFGEIFAPPPS